jgi:hypothetical protein
MQQLRGRGGGALGSPAFHAEQDTAPERREDFLEKNHFLLAHPSLVQTS